METQMLGVFSDENRILYRKLFQKIEKKGSPRIHPETFPNASGCWTHYTIPTSGGYGQMMAGGKSYTLHRLSWWLHNGCPIAPHNYHDSHRFHVAHLCDNKECCNPEHLQLQSVSQNVAEGVARCRAKKPIKEPVRNSEPCFECVEHHKSCDGGIPCERCKEKGLECVKKEYKGHSATFKAGECSGEKNANCKITDAKLLELHGEIQKGYAYGGLKKLAEKFGVSYQIAQKIAGGTYPRLKKLLEV